MTRDRRFGRKSAVLTMGLRDSNRPSQEVWTPWPQTVIREVEAVRGAARLLPHRCSVPLSLAIAVSMAVGMHIYYLHAAPPKIHSALHFEAWSALRYQAPLRATRILPCLSL